MYQDKKGLIFAPQKFRQRHKKYAYKGVFFIYTSIASFPDASRGFRALAPVRCISAPYDTLLGINPNIFRGRFFGNTSM